MEHSEEILNVKCLEYSSPSWARSVLANDQVGEGKSMCQCWFRSMCRTDDRQSRSNRKMEGSSGRTQVVFVLPRCSGIDGEAIEFEWTNFAGFSSLSIFKEIQQDLERRTFQPEEFKDRIIFMSMFNDIEWKTIAENCMSNADKVKNYAMRFSQWHWTLLGPGSEEKWYGSSSYAQTGEWNSTANKMVQRFKETGHLVFKSINALSRGILKQKKDKDTLVPNVL